MALRIPVSRASSNLSPTALSITTPDSSGAILPELDDFATAVLGDPWDMNEPSDLGLFMPIEVFSLIAPFLTAFIQRR